MGPKEKVLKVKVAKEWLNEWAEEDIRFWSNKKVDDSLIDCGVAFLVALCLYQKKQCKR